MMMIKLFLDDIRTPPSDEWVVAKTVNEAIEFLKTHHVTHLSLDHDLGEGNGSGYDVMCWLEEAIITTNCHLPEVTFHTDNPVGRKNMTLVLNSIRRRMK